MSKYSIDRLMSNKPAEFMKSVKQTLDERKQKVLDNKLYIFSEEMNQLFNKKG